MIKKILYFILDTFVILGIPTIVFFALILSVKYSIAVQNNFALTSKEINMRIYLVVLQDVILVLITSIFLIHFYYENGKNKKQ